MWPETRNATPISTPDLLNEPEQIPSPPFAHVSVLSISLSALPSKAPLFLPTQQIFILLDWDTGRILEFCWNTYNFYCWSGLEIFGRQIWKRMFQVVEEARKKRTLNWQDLWRVKGQSWSRRSWKIFSISPCHSTEIFLEVTYFVDQTALRALASSWRLSNGLW